MPGPPKPSSSKPRTSKHPHAPKDPTHAKLKAKNASIIVSNSKTVDSPDSDPDNEGSDDEQSSSEAEDKGEAKGQNDAEPEECEYFPSLIVYEVLTLISARLPLKEWSPCLRTRREGPLCALVHLA
jgi:hypothetical protein